MSLYFNTFTRIDIYTFTTIDPYQFECTQSFDFHILISVQSLFYQQEKLPDENISIFLRNLMSVNQ